MYAIRFPLWEMVGTNPASPLGSPPLVLLSIRLLDPFVRSHRKMLVPSGGWPGVSGGAGRLYFTESCLAGSRFEASELYAT